jgi:hypothetical protein
MADIFKEIEFSTIRQDQVVVGARWVPRGSSMENESSSSLGGENIRIGDLILIIVPKDGNFQKISATIISSPGGRVASDCRRAGRSIGCNVIFSQVDICRVISYPINIQTVPEVVGGKFSVKLRGHYVVTKVGFWSRVTERPGRELQRTQLEKSSVCRSG